MLTPTAPAESCADGVCVLDGACAVDDDCPGARVCGGVCRPSGGCEGDPHDAAEGPAPLTYRTYTGLVLCDGDDDVYAVTVPAGEGLRVTLRHDPAAGDLALELGAFGGGLPGGDVQRSDGRHGVEVLGLGAAAEERQATITVRGRAGFSVPYSLTLERPAPGACVDDAREGLLGNDDGAHATPVAPGSLDHVVCPGDEDWFAVEVPSGNRLVAAATAEGAVERLALSLHDEEGRPLAEGETAGESCQCFIDENGEEQCDCLPDDGRRLVARLDVPGGGRRLVRVTSRHPEAVPTLLSLVLEPLEDAEARACAAPLELRPDAPLPLAEGGVFDVFTASCGFGMGDDFVARFELDAPATVSVWVTGDGFLTTVALRADCDDAESETHCATGEDARIDGVRLDAGTWYVVVKSGGGPEPALHLAVE